VRLYDPDELFFGTNEYIQITKGVSYGVIAIIVVGFFTRPIPSRGWAALFWLLAILFLTLHRFIFRRIVRRRLRAGLGPDRVLIIGGGEEAKSIAERLIQTGRMEVVGFLDDFNPIGQEVISGISIKGVPLDYEKIAKKEGITHIIVVPVAVGWETINEILSATRNNNSLKISLSPGFGEISVRLHVSYTGYVPLLRFQPGYNTGLDKFVKSVIDMVIASCLLVLSLPIQMFITLWTLWRKGRPILVEDKIIGRFGEPLKIFSYRMGSNVSTLIDTSLETQEESNQQKNIIESVENGLFECRVNKLPQLINVILGQMSLVGPRPIGKETARQYGIWLPRMLSVKPGLIGPWVLQKVNDPQFEISQTISYLDAWTPWKDLQFLQLTAFSIMQRILTYIFLNSREPINRNVATLKQERARKISTRRDGQEN
jgi:undecaprenyl-phosphate galactose phosphotransferase